MLLVRAHDGVAGLWYPGIPIELRRRVLVIDGAPRPGPKADQRRLRLNNLLCRQAGQCANGSQVLPDRRVACPPRGGKYLQGAT